MRPTLMGPSPPAEEPPQAVAAKTRVRPARTGMILIMSASQGGNPEARRSLDERQRSAEYLKCATDQRPDRGDRRGRRRARRACPGRLGRRSGPAPAARAPGRPLALRVMNAEEPPALRPQTLMLTFLGNYVLGRDIGVFSGSYLDVMARVGVSGHATRSTLTRMVSRGLLRRQKRGRKMYFGLTGHSTGILKDGEARVWSTAPVNLDCEGEWTLVGFSLPEEWRNIRH